MAGTKNVRDNNISEESKAEKKAKATQVEEEEISKLSEQENQERPKPKGQEEEEEEGQQPWVPNELEIDPQRQERLKQEMEISMKKVESSEYYKALLKQFKSREVSNHFGLLLGSETQLQMVIYGIGSIESMENPRSQLSIAILMKKEFDWIDDNIQVFDPVLSATETSVIQSLGCTVLSVNEHARRKVVKPTLFYMPCCVYDLYNNLLQANLRMISLSKMAIFGSSLSSFRHHLIQTIRPIVAAGIEFAIHTDDYNGSFHNFSLHFFTTCVDSELPLLDLN